MKNQFTHAVEDYLKIIYDLCTTQGRASTTQIAELLEVKPASVTGMVQKLASLTPPLVEYERHRGVVLTPAGEQVALEIIRHHRLLETFLHETLGYSWDAIHEEADRLEHVISEEFEERIAQALGNPTYDPHGHPIPDRDLQMPSHATTRLWELRPPQRATLQRVSDSDPELLRYLHERGLLPGVAIQVLEYSSFDENLTLQVEGQSDAIVIGERITQQIFVEEIV